jgi:hypothetical protein
MFNAEIILPGSRDFSRSQGVLRDLADLRTKILDQFSSQKTKHRQFEIREDLKKISLPEDEPQGFISVLFQGDEISPKIQVELEYPGNIVHDHYLGYKLMASDNEWLACKNPFDKSQKGLRANNPYKRKTFKNPVDLLRRIFDEFNANSSSYINRKVKFSRDLSA